MKVQIGTLNKRIEILGHSVWAAFKRENAKDAQDLRYEHVRFFLRTPLFSLDGLNTVLYNGKSYDVTFVNDFADNRQFTEILARRLSGFALAMLDDAVITLRLMTYPIVAGIQLEEVGAEHDVVAKHKSNVIGDDYSAAQDGWDVEDVFYVLADQYAAEQELIYAGERYDITKRVPVDAYIELTAKRRSGK